MNNKIFSVKANDFGPLSNIDVEIKPLTIFIGPNNTGKSYTSMLIYSIFKGNQTFEYLGKFRDILYFDFEDYFFQSSTQKQMELNDTISESYSLENKILLEWLDETIKILTKRNKIDIIFSEISEDYKLLFYKIFLRNL